MFEMVASSSAEACVSGESEAQPAPMSELAKNVLSAMRPVLAASGEYIVDISCQDWLRVSAGMNHHASRPYSCDQSVLIKLLLGYSLHFQRPCIISGEIEDMAAELNVLRAEDQNIRDLFAIVLSSCAQVADDAMTPAIRSGLKEALEHLAALVIEVKRELFDSQPSYRIEE